MKVDIEKITNGFVVVIDGKKTFCDVPEAICGLTSEAVLAECARLEKGGADNGTVGSALAQAMQAMREVDRSPFDHIDDAAWATAAVAAAAAKQRTPQRIGENLRRMVGFDPK